MRGTTAATAGENTADQIDVLESTKQRGGDFSSRPEAAARAWVGKGLGDLVSEIRSAGGGGGGGGLCSLDLIPRNTRRRRF